MTGWLTPRRAALTGVGAFVAAVLAIVAAVVVVAATVQSEAMRAADLADQQAAVSLAITVELDKRTAARDASDLAAEQSFQAALCVVLADATQTPAIVALEAELDCAGMP